MAQFEFPDDKPRVLAGREKIPVYMFRSIVSNKVRFIGFIT